MHSPWIKTLRNASLLCATGLLAACGSAGETGEDAESFGTSELPLAPGSNAAFVSSTIPTTMAPGERLNVQVVMQNTGTAMDGSNTWTPAAYALARTNNFWGWASTAVPVNTPVGSNATFNFVITAPAAGTYAFGARMRQDVQFGQTVNIPNIVVSNATTPRWSCTYLPGSSSVPTTLAPGQTQAVSIVVQNSGTATWQTAGTYLKSQDNPTSFWGQTVAPLTSPVPAGGTATFNFSIKAPSTPGSYSLRRQMQNPEVGEFLTAACLDVPITVSGSPPLNAALVSQDFPAVMAPSESRVVNVVLKNTGTANWTTDGSFRLGSKNIPSSLWGSTLQDLPAATAPNANVTITFAITAPATPGTYAHRWQMRTISGPNVGDFGVLINVPVTVDANAQPQFNATVVTQDIPLRLTAGRPATFRVRMANAGTSAWTGANFGLYSTNTPIPLWGITSSSLGAAETVAAAAQRDFVLNVTAPAAAGTYASYWRMRQVGTGGVGFFGEEAVTLGIEVTLCGNGTIDAGEVCDDNNLNDGDGCSSLCQTEVPRSVDLASTAADRTIVGTGENKALSNVAIGDFTGDNVRDVIVGEGATVTPAGMAFRNQAGLLRGYSGSTFFSNGANALTVYGARANDQLGALGQGLLVGDVTGDGVPDVVVSAPGADGPMNGRSNCGSTYVLRGGAGLTGIVDLGAATPHAAYVAEVYGPTAANGLRLLALGDLTGDGVSDLVLGSLNTVFIVPGGATLVGKLDLAMPPAGVITITGSGIGFAAAVGDVSSTVAADLLISSASSSPNGSESGAAWLIFGPISTARNMAQAVGSATGPNVAFFGAGANDHLGTSVQIANVLGSSRHDVIVGANQQRKAGLQVGAVSVWTGGMATGSTFDLGAGNVPSLTVLGADQFDVNGGSIGVGDWNGDGRSDIATTASSGDGPANDRDGAGELKIILGSASLGGTIDLSSYNAALSVFGAAERDLLGSFTNSVAFGDIDGDGTAELCVGSRKGGTTMSLLAPGRVDCFQ